MVRALPWRGLYAIVDPEHCVGRDPRQVAAAVLDGGCGALQLRAKTLDDRARLDLARDLVTRCRAVGVPLVVNDRPDLAVLAGADGLHLGQEDVAVPDARKLVGGLRVGVSTHDLGQARAAVEAGADLLGFGPVWATRTKERPDPVVGTGQLAEICRTVDVPVVAIGGIDVARAKEAARAGAAMVAAISAVCGAPDPAAAATALHAAGLGEA